MAVYAAVSSGGSARGLREVALRCAQGTRYCREALVALDGVEPPRDAPRCASSPSTQRSARRRVIERMADEGYLAGLARPTSSARRVTVRSRRHRCRRRRGSDRTADRSEVEGFVRTLDKVLR